MEERCYPIMVNWSLEGYILMLGLMATKPMAMSSQTGGYFLS